MTTQPSLSAADTGDRTRFQAHGSWTAPYVQTLDVEFERVADAARSNPGISIEMSGIQELDTYGAWLLERFIRRRNEIGNDTRVTGLPDRFRGMLEELGHVRGEVTKPNELRHNPVLSGIEHVGYSACRSAANLAAYTAMLGAVGEAIARTVRQPPSFRLTSVVHHLDRVAWQAVPIILLINFLIGGIIAQQGIFHFRKFGAETYVVDMVGILVFREIGVLIVSIMVAGRSGSSYTAELGSMKMREEIDALRTMGFDPVEILILPRILALVVAVPALTFLGSMAAPYGGGLATWIYGGMHPDIFTERLREAVSLTHFKVGMIKAPFMAAVIGIVACAKGLRVKGSAQSLGEKTTSSVVQAIFLVIVLDGLFAIFFASIDM
ncbi:MAG: MlaE family ABC transporter permease [Methyloligellaceae bacterium]